MWELRLPGRSSDKIRGWDSSRGLEWIRVNAYLVCCGDTGWEGMMVVFRIGEISRAKPLLTRIWCGMLGRGAMWRRPLRWGLVRENPRVELLEEVIVSRVGESGKL